jgi:hypothetical protein
LGLAPKGKRVAVSAAYSAPSSRVPLRNAFARRSNNTFSYLFSVRIGGRVIIRKKESIDNK